MSLKYPRRRSQKSLMTIMTIMTIMTNDNHDHMHAELSTDVRSCWMCLCVCDDVRHILLKESALAPRQRRQSPSCIGSVKTHQRKNAARLKSRSDTRTVLPKSERRPKIAPKNQAKTSKKSPKIKKNRQFSTKISKASKKLIKIINARLPPKRTHRFR